MKQFKNKFSITSICISFFITALFVASALLKTGIAKLDIYLGAIWVFVISLIVIFSLLHTFSKK